MEKHEKGFFKRFRQGLTKTRSQLSGRLDRVFLGKKEITPELMEELEEILFTSDIGVRTTSELVDFLTEKVARKELKNPERVREILRDHMLELLQPKPPERKDPGPGQPLVVMVCGVNGVGKTTTIGKVAHAYRSEGKSVMLVAADTFRAAAIEQLGIWAERADAQLVKQGTGADPSAVVFDALEAGAHRGVNVVLIDTAGRLHTQVNLMDQLQKIQRVAGRKLSGAPHEVWLVLDATTGQNAISQAQLFHNALGLTHIILTKLDGTAKGGIVVGITHEMGIPIRYVGIGEKIEDLQPFDPEAFVGALFD